MLGKTLFNVRMDVGYLKVLLSESCVGVFAGWSVGINMMGRMYCSGVYILIKYHNKIHVYAR